MERTFFLADTLHGTIERSAKYKQGVSDLLTSGSQDGPDRHLREHATPDTELERQET